MRQALYAEAKTIFADADLKQRYDNRLEFDLLAPFKDSVSARGGLKKRLTIQDQEELLQGMAQKGTREQAARAFLSAAARENHIHLERTRRGTPPRPMLRCPACLHLNEPEAATCANDKCPAPDLRPPCPRSGGRNEAWSRMCTQCDTNSALDHDLRDGEPARYRVVVFYDDLAGGELQSEGRVISATPGTGLAPLDDLEVVLHGGELVATFTPPAGGSVQLFTSYMPPPFAPDEIIGWHKLTRPWADFRLIDLLFYDTAGESFGSDAAIRQFASYVLSATGLVFLVDPLACPELKALLAHAPTSVGSVDPPVELLSRIRKVYEDEHVVAHHQKLGIETAVVLTKEDLLRDRFFRDNRHAPGVHHPDYRGGFPAAIADHAPPTSAAICRALLRVLGAERVDCRVLDVAEGVIRAVVAQTEDVPARTVAAWLVKHAPKLPEDVHLRVLHDMVLWGAVQRELSAPGHDAESYLAALLGSLSGGDESRFEVLNVIEVLKRSAAGTLKPERFLQLAYESSLYEAQELLGRFRERILSSAPKWSIDFRTRLAGGILADPTAAVLRGKDLPLTLLALNVGGKLKGVARARRDALRAIEDCRARTHGQRFPLARDTAESLETLRAWVVSAQPPQEVIAILRGNSGRRVEIPYGACMVGMVLTELARLGMSDSRAAGELLNSWHGHLQPVWQRAGGDFFADLAAFRDSLLVESKRTCVLTALAFAAESDQRLQGQVEHLVGTLALPERVALVNELRARVWLVRLAHPVVESPKERDESREALLWQSPMFVAILGIGVAIGWILCTFLGN